MRFRVLIFSLIASSSALALSQKDIINNNSRAVVYLEVRDPAGGIRETGTGFIVSHDGYVVTVAHIKVDPTQKLWAVIGQRAGTSYPLTFRDKDENGDVALWQLPQSPVCRQSVTISSKAPEMLDPVLSLGFPGSSGLTPNILAINNLQTPRGFFKTDGFLESGNSGGPVFSQGGHVVAIVHGGGQPGTENNEVIPIALALNLIRKRNVSAAVDAPVTFADTCYSSCRDPQHGIASWTTEASWSENSGWLGGGNSQAAVCAGIANGVKTQRKADAVEVTGMSESTKKDVLGHVEYKYHCSGLVRFGPVYVERRSAACGLWN